METEMQRAAGKAATFSFITLPSSERQDRSRRDCDGTFG